MSSAIRQIDAAIQAGRGAAASVLGETHDVRRMSPTTNGSISSNAPVISAFQAYVPKKAKKMDVENDLFSLNAYEAKCDNTQLQIGDVLTQTGYKSDGRVYTYAQQRPAGKSIFVRTEWNCFISRPHPGAGNPEQQPTSGAVFIEERGAISKLSEQVLVLQNGTYSFEDAGASPAGIYVGMQQLNRIRDGKGLGTPTDLPDEHFLFYVPYLPGEQIERKDRINLGNSDRYEVLSVYSSDAVGLVGSIIIAGMLGT
jgi:hypothetical protein